MFNRIISYHIVSKPSPCFTHTFRRFVRLIIFFIAYFCAHSR